MKQIILPFFFLALFGAGCWVAKPQASQTVTTTQNVAATTQTSNEWLVFKDVQQGLEFQYPPTAKNVTTSTNETYGANAAFVSFDLGKTVDDPEAKSIPETRLDVFRVMGSAKTQEGRPIINDAFYYEFGWTPEVNVSIRRETFGSYEFSRSAYADAGLGNLYSTYAYAYPLGNNEFIVFRYVIHSVNCGNYEGTGFKCISFDETRDIKLPERILATVKLSPPSALNISFINGNISEKTQDYEIKANYPVMDGGVLSLKNAVNTEIKSFIDSEIVQFRQDAKGAAQNSPGPWFMNYNYNIPYNKNGLISIVMQKEFYTGGAHPNTAYKTFLFDVKKAKFLDLGDLFQPRAAYLSSISKYASNALEQKFLKDAQQNGQTQADWFKDGAEPKAENYQAFDLDQVGLNIIFAPYQVAAYAYGTQEVLIPYSELKQIIRPEYAFLAQK